MLKSELSKVNQTAGFIGVSVQVGDFLRRVEVFAVF